MCICMCVRALVCVLVGEFVCGRPMCVNHQCVCVCLTLINRFINSV